MVQSKLRTFFERQLNVFHHQIIHAIPKLGKITISSTSETINSLATRGHHLIEKHQFFCMNKLTSRKIYFILTH